MCNVFCVSCFAGLQCPHPPSSVSIRACQSSNMHVHDSSVTLTICLHLVPEAGVQVCYAKNWNKPTLPWQHKLKNKSKQDQKNWVIGKIFLISFSKATFLFLVMVYGKISLLTHFILAFLAGIIFSTIFYG